MNETPLMFARRLLHGPDGLHFVRTLDTIWDRFEPVEAIAILMAVSQELGLPPLVAAVTLAKALVGRGITSADDVDQVALGRVLREIREGLHPGRLKPPESS